MDQHESTYNTWPRVRARVVTLETEIHTWELALQTSGTAPNGDIDFGVIRRAEIQLTDRRDELHELRELLSFWENRQKLPISWHLLLVIAAVYGAIFLTIGLYLIGLTRG